MAHRLEAATALMWLDAKSFTPIQLRQPKLSSLDEAFPACAFNCSSYSVILEIAKRGNVNLERR